MADWAVPVAILLSALVTGGGMWAGFWRIIGRVEAKTDALIESVKRLRGDVDKMRERLTEHEKACAEWRERYGRAGG